MSLFQRITIALARSPMMGRSMRAMAARSSLARRFVGGADVEAAVQDVEDVPAELPTEEVN